MKILLVVTGLGVGGAERLLVGLADRFVGLGHEVVLARLNGEAELRPSDSRVRLVNFEIGRSPLEVLKGMRRFRKLVVKFRPDVVNSHLIHANILSRLVRLLVPIPRLVSSAHSTSVEGRGRMIAYRLTDCFCDLSTNVSEESVKVFEQQRALRPGRMVAIHNGVDTEEFSFNEEARPNVRLELGIGDATPLLIAVGRLWPAKDYNNLLRAFAAVKNASEKPRLAIIGDGPLRGELLSLAASLNVEDRVRFLGVRHDVVDLLSAADLFILSSAYEGMPMVLVEAMACGVVPVATDCGGVDTVIGDSGFLVPPRDTGALTVAIERALSMEPEEKHRLAQAGRKRVVEHFSLDATAKRYLDVYKGNGSGSKTGEPV